jgi:hypothetical protein
MKSLVADSTSRRVRNASLSYVLAALVAWAPVAARAEGEPPPTTVTVAEPAPPSVVHCKRIELGSRALEEIDARVRLRFISQGLAHAAFKARFWAWTWAGIYSALTVGNGILALTSSNPDDRTDAYIGTAASFIGLMVLVVLPLKVMGDQRWLERRLRKAPADEDTCRLLADAERLLIRDADSQAFGKSPLVHAGNFGFNIAIALLLGVGFGHWNAAVITGLTGIAIGEIQTFTQPSDTIAMLRNYRFGRLTATPPKPRTTWMLAPTVTHDRYGVTLGVSF